MKYEIVTLEEKIAVGISARTNNAAPDMGAVIGGLWNRFYSEGIYASIPDKGNEKALGIYTEYAGDEKSDYTVVVACEAAKEPQGGVFTVCRIPAGPYAKFIVHGDMVKAVAAAWQEIWQMDLPRSFQCDFEEYQNDSMDHAEIHIYVGLSEDPSRDGAKDNCAGTGKDGRHEIESRCGLLCSQCSYREQMNCQGCVHMEKPFWGDNCPVKACCEEKKQEHCGTCSAFPCELLTSFAYDENQGDGGKRIEQCRVWSNQ